MEFIYPLPEQAKPTVTDQIDFLHKCTKWIKEADYIIETDQHLLDNPNDIQNLYVTRAELIEELAEKKLLKRRLIRMFNDQLELLKIKTQ